MKKLIAPAFCLSLIFGSANMVASSSPVITISVNENDERTVVKPEELPESIKKTLAADDYKGWSVKEAALINNKADAAASHYEVTLAKEQETKVVKFHKDGTLVK